MKVVEFRRHGRWNRKEDRLTPEGLEETEKLTRRLCKFDIIIVGPNQRARETGEIVAQKLKKPLEVWEGLEEITSTEGVEERVKRVLEYILLERKEEKILIIAGGRLIGALYLHLLGKSYKKLEDFHLFDFLRGFRITISACY